MNEKFVPGTSRKQRTARTLLLRMAADEERAARIRQLKKDNPGLKWQQIADHVGVTQRAAQSWQEKGEISYANAKKLAQLFDVTPDYILRGVEITQTPPLLEQFAGNGNHLERIADALASIDERLENLECALKQRGDGEIPAIVAQTIRESVEEALRATRARSSRGKPPAKSATPSRRAAK